MQTIMLLYIVEAQNITGFVSIRRSPVREDATTDFDGTTTITYHEENLELPQPQKRQSPSCVCTASVQMNMDVWWETYFNHATEFVFKTQVYVSSQPCCALIIAAAPRCKSHRSPHRPILITF